MKSMKTLFAFAALMIWVSSLEAGQEKTFICHVGHKYGPDGETYDPACAPVEENGYFCADAGKIDLIEVTARAAEKHLENDSHAYFDGVEWVYDYPPVVDVAEGMDVDTDGDGIDEGCETEATLTCPCWAGQTVEDLAAMVAGWTEIEGYVSTACPYTNELSYGEARIQVVFRGGPNGYTPLGISSYWQNGRGDEGKCEISIPPYPTASLTIRELTPEAVVWAKGCNDELAEIMEAGTFCPD